MYYKKINIKKDKENCILRKGETVEFKVNSEELDIDGKHKLFFNCEDSSCPTLKNEAGAELLYMLIDDSLNYDKAEYDRYCLDFSCKEPLPYAKRVLKKIVWQPLIYGLYAYDNFRIYANDWNYGIMVKAEGLKKEQGGYLHLKVEKWNVKEGVSPHDTTSAPDETYVLEIPEGSYPYTLLKKDIFVEKDTTACVIVTLEGENYSGNVYFERPFFSDNTDRNMLPEFEKGSIGLERFAWMGQNLSKREWPKFNLKLNGNTFFEGEVFLKVHRFSPLEFDIPADSFNCGENVISITYESDYIDTIPLLIDEVVLLESEKTDFTVIKCPEEYVAGESVKILVETEKHNIVPQITSDVFAVEDVAKFEEVNLHIISLMPLKNVNNAEFTISYGEKSEKCVVKRCIKKIKDNVISGSGDMIYIDISDLQAVFNYMKWYIAHDIGNFVTIRPVYRWGGQRTVNENVWKLFNKFCEKMGILYVHISDGRDIPGLATNPSLKMLEGKNFLGRQLHERDGQLFYWGVYPREIQSPLEEFFDLAARTGREYPDTVEGSMRPFNIKWSDGAKYSFRRNLCESTDISEACHIVSKELENLCSDSYKRHTGPSIMFKYFYENGFDWTGAETMDGATEVLLAFLRGASNAYSKDKYGVHLALQWSTYPHDTLQRYKRYLLSLYVPYMHGVTDINTEEGLWFIEARYDYHNRISDVCEEHRKKLRQFNKFMRTHSRTGSFYTPIAFLHGRMDGWNGFNSHTIWGMPSIKMGEESASWKLLKIFYPLNSVEAYGFTKTGCIPEGNDKPFGIFSGTPMGNVDGIPVENGDFSSYSVLVFAGYNCADNKDLDRLENYVKDGGIVVSAWPHFSNTVLKEDIDNHKLNIVEHNLVSLLADGKPEFVKDSIEGKEVMVCCNVPESCRVVEYTDGGIPLVYSVEYGKGKMVFVNSLYYPGNESVMPVYSRTIKNISEEILKKEDVIISCGEDVQYTIFTQSDGTKHYYFTAVDWYNDCEDARVARITFDGASYDIHMKFGDLIKLVTDGKTAVWPKNDDAEVLTLNGDYFEAQGYGKQEFYVANCGAIKTVTVDFVNNYTAKIEL